MKTPASDKKTDAGAKPSAEEDREYYQGTRLGSALGGGRVRKEDDEEFSRKGLGRRDYGHRDKG